MVRTWQRPFGNSRAGGKRGSDGELRSGQAAEAQRGGIRQFINRLNYLWASEMQISSVLLDSVEVLRIAGVNWVVAEKPSLKIGSRNLGMAVRTPGEREGV